MSASDRTEKVLRDIHVLFSKAEPYNGSKKNVIVDKNEMMELLKELNSCMYDMMEEHELSKVRKDKANREMQKQGDDIIFEATRKAEDVYAASIMYTDRALVEIREVMDRAQASLDQILEKASDEIKAQERTIRSNQTELKSQLEDFIDTQKYLQLIEDENKRRAQAKEKGEATHLSDEPSYANVVPEIRINTDYFLQNGIPLDSDESAGNAVGADQGEDEENVSLSEDLDREYFAWKEGDDTEDTAEGGKGFFARFGKK